MTADGAERLRRKSPMVELRAWSWVGHTRAHPRARRWLSVGTKCKRNIRTGPPPHSRRLIINQALQSEVSTPVASFTVARSNHALTRPTDSAPDVSRPRRNRRLACTIIYDKLCIHNGVLPGSTRPLAFVHSIHRSLPFGSIFLHPFYPIVAP